MRKDFGKQTWFYPLPVLIIGTYDEDGMPNAMNAAWGGIYDTNKVMVCLSPEHKTTANIRAKGAWTLSFADAAHVKEADYLGIVSGNDVSDKLQKAGLHAIKSNFVDAPIIEELPMALECKLERINADGVVVGSIINVSADEKILDSDGKIDRAKLDPISFDPVHSAYCRLGAKVGNAFADGKTIKGYTNAP
jgi:flavin reductase (DIM6/NTAB) family NADH-FMN oxidoreductase RutF